MHILSRTLIVSTVLGPLNSLGSRPSWQRNGKIWACFAECATCMLMRAAAMFDLLPTSFVRLYGVHARAVLTSIRGVPHYPHFVPAWCTARQGSFHRNHTPLYLGMAIWAWPKSRTSQWDLRNNLHWAVLMIVHGLE